ncbi:MAG: hypothetical protein A2V67_11450 [Deltaproteobacteria bacterium RBG_13_61_14]|nr:MAG: hypothetical protein A2V67_11450 [Deltaproteobacteria bacterium RBG_13_61_14]
MHGQRHHPAAEQEDTALEVKDSRGDGGMIRGKIFNPEREREMLRDCSTHDYKILPQRLSEQNPKRFR